MISNKDISTWKITLQWSNHTSRVEGHGSIYHPYTSGRIEGSLVSLTNERGVNKYLFIADEPVIDTDNVLGGEKYFFHEGVFEDENAYGRCWFVNYNGYKDGIIRTNNDGVFTKREYHKGLVV